MRLTLLRHGETSSNLVRALDTRPPGADLTDLGREQARVVARQLADRDIEQIFASNLVRTQQTVAPLAARLHLPVVVREGLREISAGDLEMMTGDAEIDRYHGFLADTATGRTATLPGGESAAGVLRRFDAVVDEAAATGSGHALLVSHGAMIRAWVGARTANVEAGFVGANPLRNTGTVVVEGSPDRGWTTLEWDRSPVDPTPVPTGTLGPGGEPV